MDRLKIAQYLYQLIVFQVEFEIQRLFSNIYFKNEVPQVFHNSTTSFQHS